ncbi:retrovirus-related Pol polyprotein from transposon opus [Misgurnus anguillicaudatus]|uniref:retrovirus-related Pol polyprotein from transposon opus n=1 Tax=Misgurnus anguillicaudatus TaxID=75329 RepID=UPI003CCF64B9
MEERFDFSDRAFRQHRDPVANLVDTFNELYIDSEEEQESETMSNEQVIDPIANPVDLPLPPPPLEFHEDGLPSNNENQRMSSIEEHLADIEHRIVNLATSEMVSENFQKFEERFNYGLQRELDRVKQMFQSKLEDLNRSFVDCLKRRDKQIEQKFKTVESFIPKPLHTSTTTTHKMYQTSPDSVAQKSLGPVPYAPFPCSNPPIKIELPTFSNLDSEDPVEFIDRFEEYNELRPLYDEELLASLAVSLKGTAKSWWRAEKPSIRDWSSFKEKFLFSFLNEDHKEVAAQKLANYHQGVNENIRDFAFNYRALCLKNNSQMTELEIVQATLRNCNPRLASLLRGTVKTVDDLVRLGTQIEKDWDENKRRWKQGKDEEQRKNAAGGRGQQSHLMLMDPTPSSHNSSVLQTSIILNQCYFNAVIDTGSTFSLLQHRVWQRLKRKDELLTKSSQTFMLANGQSQRTQGKIVWECEIYGVKRDVTFYVMDNENLAVPVILGLDFLKEAKVVIDFNSSCVYVPDASSNHPMCFSEPQEVANVKFYAAQSIGWIPKEEDHQLIEQAVENSHVPIQVKSQLKHLLCEWPTVCTHKIGRTSCIKHEIKTNDELPLRKKPYRVSRAKNDFIEEQIQELLQQNIIRPSTSPWASPVVVVDKKDGGLRLCVDYRGLNSKTHLDAFPMPHITDILDALQGAKVFSTLDSKSGYWQVEMSPDSVEKTAFTTASGLYEFLCLPFGLKNSAASFQRLMEQVLREHKNKFCMVYIDDIIVYSPDIQTHLHHLQLIFNSLHTAGLTLNLKKCKFIHSSLDYLGHTITAEGVKVNVDKVEAVKMFPPPTSLKELQRFLRLAAWYHRFISDFSTKAAPLHALKKKGGKWMWTDECQKAFELLKDELTKAPVLGTPNFNVPFSVQTDASDIGLGAVLTQEVDGEEKVIAYASRLLRGAERSYSVSEKECLAVVWAVEKWHHYLEGNAFEVVTDHASLVWLFQHPKPSSRLERWTIRLQGYHFTVRYRRGQCNVVPDVLSRRHVDESTAILLHTPAKRPFNPVTCELPVDLSQVADEQKKDAECQELFLKAEDQSSKDIMRTQYVVKNDVLFRSVPVAKGGQRFQLLVPTNLKEVFLNYAHDNPLSGHLGKFKTLMRLLEFVYWPSIRTDVWQYCKQCEKCQQHKPTNLKPAGALQSVPIVEPGYMIGMDIMGPFPRSSRQNQYLLVIVDYFSKWVEIFPMRSAKSTIISRILIEEIFTRWGTPAYIVSDRGTQFTSNLLHQLCKQWQVTQKLTTAYHPQSNLTERINRNLKVMIATYVENNHHTWDQWICEFRFALNTAWHESTGFSPAEIALGRQLKGPLQRALQSPPDPDHPSYDTIERQELLFESVRENVDKAQAKQKKYYDLKRRNQDFQEGDLVWVRTHPLSSADDGFMAKISPKWRGPAKIVKRLGPVNYKVVMLSDSKQVDSYHTQNLKICHVSNFDTKGKGM